MLRNGNLKRTDTTVGELVVALSDAAFEICPDKKEAYGLVATALKNLLPPSRPQNKRRNPEALPEAGGVGNLRN